MTKPKLTMSKADVHLQMASAFRKEFKELNFSKNQTFERIDEKSELFFQLETDYHEKAGEYSFSGVTSLYKSMPNNQAYAVPYKLSGSIELEEDEEGEPVVRFKGLINAFEK